MSYVTQPYLLFNDIDGDPLDDGYIYIGDEGLNPETNPVATFWDAAMTVPAAQPIRTTNGFPSRSGAAARIYTATNYSITVKNKNGSLVFSSLSVPVNLDASGGTIAGILTLQGDGTTFLEMEKPAVRTWQWVYENVVNMGSAPMLVLTNDNSTGLKFYVADVAGGQRIYIWDESVALPNVPHTGIKPTFAVYGDIVCGDIVAIESNPMTYFIRDKLNLAETAVTQLFSARAINNDVDGGAGIVYAPAKNGGGAVSDGYIDLNAYGLGTGELANGIVLANRSAVDTITRRWLLDGQSSSKGDLRPMADSSYSLGAVAKRIKSIFTAALRYCASTTATNFEEHLIKLVSNAAYTTIATLSPSGVAGSYVRGIIDVTVAGQTGGVGNGARVSKWYFDINAAAPTVAVIGADITSGAGAPKFRLNISGNDIQLQVESSDGVGEFGGVMSANIIAPNPGGTARTYTIS